MAGKHGEVEQVADVVVTGFRSFPGVPDNPSQRLIEALQAKPSLLPPNSECRLIEVSYTAIAPTLEDVLREPPLALVLTGFSARAEGLRLETRAHDYRSADHEDAFGFKPETGSDIREYMEQVRADLPAIAGAVAQLGIACSLSDDAGAYVCNHTYHAALSRIAELDLPTLAVFVHIPAIEGTALARSSAGAMSLDNLTRGIATIAERLVA